MYSYIHRGCIKAASISTAIARFFLASMVFFAFSSIASIFLLLPLSQARIPASTAPTRTTDVPPGESTCESRENVTKGPGHKAFPRVRCFFGLCLQCVSLKVWSRLWCSTRLQHMILAQCFSVAGISRGDSPPQHGREPHRNVISAMC